MSYQEQPCDAASQGTAVAIPTEFPDYIEPRNRLAAREAQAQAEREQARAAQAAWYPVYVGPVARVRPLVRTHPRPPFRLHSQLLMR